MHAADKGTMRRQRGWAGLVVLLLALVIVGFLMRTVARQMGLTDGRPSAAAGAIPAGTDAGSAAGSASPTTPQDRVRAVEAEVLRQNAKAMERVDALDK